MIVKNLASRVVTVGEISLKPNDVADLGDTAKDHKGVKFAIDKGWLAESSAQELKAFTDPEGAAADAKAAAAAAEEAAKKEKK